MASSYSENVTTNQDTTFDDAYARNGTTAVPAEAQFIHIDFNIRMAYLVIGILGMLRLSS